MIRIRELASVLCDKHQLSKNEADFFISLWVDVLTTALQTDKTVKIKGLGTFKVTPVSTRESVDTDTGECIPSEGCEEITFTPENVLRDKVNAPFRQFATVTVNDGTDFSEIDERYRGIVNSGQKIESEAEADDKPVEAPQPNFIETEKETNRPEAETEVPELQASISEVPEPEPQPKEEITETPEEEITETPGLQSESTAVQDEWEEENNRLAESLHRMRRRQRCLVVLVCLLLAGSAAGFCYFARLLALRDDRIDRLTLQLVSADRPTTAPQQYTASRPAVMSRQTDSTETQQQKPTLQASKYDADPRIRTGAYVITGIARTVMARKGETLSSISKTHLGPDMECYMEAVNGTKPIEEGDQVKIPALELKKKRK